MTERHLTLNGNDSLLSDEFEDDDDDGVQTDLSSIQSAFSFLTSPMSIKPTRTRTPTPIPTRMRTPTPIPTRMRTPTPIPTRTRTPTPIPTRTPTITIKQELIHLIWNHGKVKISSLGDRYCDMYGKPLIVRGNLSELIDQIQDIKMKKHKNGNHILTVERPCTASSISSKSMHLNDTPSDYDGSNIDESSIVAHELVNMIQKNGQVRMDKVRVKYKEMYGKPLDLKGKYRKLSNTIRKISTIKMTRCGNGGNYLLSVDEDPYPYPYPSLIPQDDFKENKDPYPTHTHETNIPPQKNVDINERLVELCGGSMQPLQVHHDAQSMFDLLPAWISNDLEMLDPQDITDIALDYGRKPYCWYKDERKFLSQKDDETIQKDDLKFIVEKLGRIGSDNRTGIDKQLHRISCIRDNEMGIIGLTIRIGRHVEGNADIIRDLLQDTDASILFLGEPGTGKTTIVREVTKILAERKNVFVIDTSNEIAGNGQIPHPCIGMARKLMVQSLDKQADVMIECVQNHTPDVIIVDEIGRTEEVKAAATSKNRGVRMIASAHGNLRSLMKNRDLVGLLGGLQHVTLGDIAAKEEAARKGRRGRNIQKQKTERGGAPVFDIIIELRKGRRHEWEIVLNTAKACDDILDGGQYQVQRRLRDKNSGSIFVEWDRL